MARDGQAYPVLESDSCDNTFDLRILSIWESERGAERSPSVKNVRRQASQKFKSAGYLRIGREKVLASFCNPLFGASWIPSFGVHPILLLPRLVLLRACIYIHIYTYKELPLQYGLGQVLPT